MLCNPSSTLSKGYFFRLGPDQPFEFWQSICHRIWSACPFVEWCLPGPMIPSKESWPPLRHPYALSLPPDMCNRVVTSPQLSEPQRPFPPPVADRSTNHFRNQSKEGPRPATPAEVDRPGSSTDVTGASSSPKVRNYCSRFRHPSSRSSPSSE